MTIKEQLKDNIKLHMDFRKGTITDQSNNSNNGRFQGTPHWGNSSVGKALQLDGTADYIELDADATLDFLDSDWSVATRFKIVNGQGETQAVINSGRSSGTDGFIFHYRNDLDQLNIEWKNDAVVNQIRANFSSGFSLVGWNTVVFAWDDSLATLHVLLNGVYSSHTLDSAVLGVPSIEGRNIGRRNTGAGDKFFSGQVAEVIEFNTLLSPAQMSQLYNEMEQEAHINAIPKATVLPENSFVDATNGSMFAFFNGELETDLSGNGVDGTFLGEKYLVSGINGKATYFGDVGHLSYNRGEWGALANGSSAISYDLWLKVEGSTGDALEMVIGQYISVGNGWNLRVDPSGAGFKLRVGARSAAADSYQSHQSTSVYEYGVWMHVVGIIDFANDKIELYVNSEKEGETSVTFSSSTFVFTIHATTDDYIGSGGNSSQSLCIVDAVRQYTTTLSPDQIIRLYNRSKGKLRINLLNEDVEETVSNVTSGLVSNTGFEVRTGTWAVTNESAGEGKALKCVSAGRNVVKLFEGFGTWEFNFYKGTALNSTEFGIFETNAVWTDGGQNGYKITLSSTNTIFLHRITAGGAVAVFQTSAAYFADETLYTVRMTRASDGTFTIYILGGSFTSWTQVGTGINTDHVSGFEYITLQVGTLDEISLIKHYLTVRDPTN